MKINADGLKRASPREWTLAAATTTLLVGLLIYKFWVLPAYDAWQGARAVAVAKQAEYAKLVGYMSVKEAVSAASGALSPAVFSGDSDQIVLSRFLRHVETLVRHPSMTIVNAKPGVVEDFNAYRRFPIRLTVSGPPPEVTRFVQRFVNGDDAVGLESFSVRGVQGGNLIECVLSVWFVGLTPSTDQAAAPRLETEVPDEG